MKTIALALLLLSSVAYAAEQVLTFDRSPDVTVTGYRAYFRATQDGETFKTLDTPSSPLTFDDTGFPTTYYVCVAATDGQGVYSPCSDSVRMDMGQPTRVWPTQGWKSRLAIVWDRSSIMNVGGFTWPGPVWTMVGGSISGIPLASPTVQIGGIFFCPYTTAYWDDALVECEYKP